MNPTPLSNYPHTAIPSSQVANKQDLKTVQTRKKPTNVYSIATMNRMKEKLLEVLVFDAYKEPAGQLIEKEMLTGECR